MKLKYGYMLLGAMSLMLLLFVMNWVRMNTDNFNYFQSFSVTLINQSDYDIVSVELGLVGSSSTYLYTKLLKAGDKSKIKPQLSLVGEGSVYLKYTDTRGITKETTACGYTESLSGRSTITIGNDRIVENIQKCL
jgi:hypothetical protein